MQSFESHLSVSFSTPTEVIRMLGESIFSIKTDNALTFESWLTTTDTASRVLARVLVDCGATSCFVDNDFVTSSSITTSPLEAPIPVRNADGSLNRGGPILSVIDVFLSTPLTEERITLEVTSLAGPFDIILGLPWLKRHNPLIDWVSATIRPRNDPYGPEHDQLGNLIRVLGSEDAGPLDGAGLRSLSVDDKLQMNANPSDEFSKFASPIQWDEDSLEERHPSIRHLNTDHSRSTTAEEDMRQFVPPKYWDYSDIFTRSTFDSLPDHSEFDHAIDLDDSFKPQRGKIYPISPREQKELDKFLEENLASGRIRPSKSPQAAPFFFTAKMEEVNAPGSDPGLRPIQDYRYLNSHTIKNRYPLPLLSEILQQPKLRTAKYFTTLDIRWGFNNIRIKEGDEWKAAFITNRGLFEPTVMFFGLCNSPPTFQHMINERFKEVLSSGCVWIYVDDCIICGDTLEELEYWTRKVLDIIRKCKLSCKPVKCQFEKTEVKFLGTIISSGQIAINPAKIAAITEWPTPKKVKDIESFLGTLNFWRKFVRGFSDIARPLNKLRQKDVPFVWTDECQKSFDALKQSITSAPVLRTPQPDLPYLLETDASGFAIGAILSQPHEGQFHPVGFFPRLFYPPNAITRLMTANSSQSFVRLRNGDIYSKVHLTQSLSRLTTKPSNSS